MKRFAVVVELLFLVCVVSAAVDCCPWVKRFAVVVELVLLLCVVSAAVDCCPWVKRFAVVAELVLLVCVVSVSGLDVVVGAKSNVIDNHTMYILKQFKTKHRKDIHLLIKESFTCNARVHEYVYINSARSSDRSLATFRILTQVSYHLK